VSSKVLEDVVPLLDAHVAVAEGADCLPGDARPEEVGQGEVAPWGAPLVVLRSLERRPNGAALRRVPPDLLTLPVAEIGRIGEQQRSIFLQRLRREVFLVHEVKEEAAF